MGNSGKASNLKDLLAFIKEYAGGLIAVISGLAGSAFLANAVQEMNPLIALAISVLIAAATFVFIMILLHIVRRRPRVAANQVAFGWLLVVVAVLLLLATSNMKGLANLAGELETAQLEIASQAQELSDAASTEAALGGQVAAQVATIEYLKTQAPAVTPDFKFSSIHDLPPCDFEKQNYPCKRYTERDEFASSIAEKTFGNARLAGRIAELYRDDTGSIGAFVADELIIIPDPLQLQDITYYQFYFGLLIHPILKCPDTNLRFPCWQVSEGESYEVLAADFYPVPTDPDCIRAANKTEWSAVAGRLDPKRTVAGVIIVLPDCSPQA